MTLVINHLELCQQTEGSRRCESGPLGYIRNRQAGFSFRAYHNGSYLTGKVLGANNHPPPRDRSRTRDRVGG